MIADYLGQAAKLGDILAGHCPLERLPGGLGMMNPSMSDTRLLKVTGDVDGNWIVDAELPDGRLVIRPADYPTVLTAGTGRPLTEEELEAFWAKHGPHMLPADHEG